jgi:beta-phosphoglucomutase-like phosphatase (HAD superfamily)
VHIIDAILFDPIGSLADFPPSPFEAIATELFGRALPAGVSGSHAYWDVLNLLEARDRPLDARERATIERYELEAVAQADAYDDVAPALAELHSLGITLIAATSLSDVALARFLERASLQQRFTDRWSRDRAGGIKSIPLTEALAAHAVSPGSAMFLTDTADGLKTAKQAGVNAILMMNDPDEAMKLTALNPTGGIVSLHELPDFVRLVIAENERA